MLLLLLPHQQAATHMLRQSRAMRRLQPKQRPRQPAGH